MSPESGVVDATQEGPVPPIPTILIADDDPGVVRALEARCRKLGLNVVTAHDGLQAILRAKTHKPSLLILDVNMPEFDGFKVCEWVFDPRRPWADVIVLTGNQDSETYDRCDSIGAYYVPKSSDAWEMIRGIVLQVLGPRHLETEEADDAPRAGAVSRDILPVAGPRVLVVDDDPGIVAAVSRRLQKLGCTTYSADNGIDAFRLAMREQPHLVIADYLMPRGGGHYLMWRMRENVATRTTPLFIITGQDEIPDDMLLHDAEASGGPVKLFRKPIDTEGMVQALRMHVRLTELHGNA